MNGAYMKMKAACAFLILMFSITAAHAALLSLAKKAGKTLLGGPMGMDIGAEIQDLKENPVRNPYYKPREKK